MKKIILALALVGIAPADHAQAHAEWVAPALAGLVLGAAIASPPQYYYPSPVYVQPPPVYYPPQYPVQIYGGSNSIYARPEYACRLPVWAPDYYGRMVIIGCR
jgi:hypothetical protein